MNTSRNQWKQDDIVYSLSLTDLVAPLTPVLASRRNDDAQINNSGNNNESRQSTSQAESAKKRNNGYSK
jgi:hypothetical protein